MASSRIGSFVPALIGGGLGLEVRFCELVLRHVGELVDAEERGVIGAVV